ncbi:MAG: glycosyltransferase [Clostridiales bacterium]|nr:MAG: glycosyltransferase [Clostridiales bacterium]
MIESTVCTLKKITLQKNFEFYEIIAVNDGSSDKSAEILKKHFGH